MKYFHGGDERAAHIVPPYYCKKATCIRIPFVGHCPTRFLFSFQIARQVFRDKLPSGERPISSSYYVPAFLHLKTDRSFPSLRSPFFSLICVWHNILVNIYDRIFTLKWNLYWNLKNSGLRIKRYMDRFDPFFAITTTHILVRYI